ncbi:DUF1048 domain-containing protein [Streptomyces sp. M19]
MGIQDIIEGKKQWRAHTARVKALPPDYRIVYKEMQKYLFKVGPVDLTDGPLLPGSSTSSRKASPRARGPGTHRQRRRRVLRRPDQGLAHLRGRLPGLHQQRTPHGRELTPVASYQRAR